MLKPIIHLLQLEASPIMEQLRLEEALLRCDARNFCLMNTGSTSAIVMGISGKAEQLINLDLLKQKPVPIIRRFSGGGTVFVNQETMFSTFICNSEDVNIAPTSETIFRWSEKMYEPVFEHPDFKLHENDYIIGEKKMGGNAQYLRKNRWLHHTSFLYDYNESDMHYLSMPLKTPKYRRERNHTDFLCRLNQFFPSKEHLQKKIIQALHLQFHVIEVHIQDLKQIFDTPHRKATMIVKI